MVISLMKMERLTNLLFLKPDEEKPGNIFAFETGYGEGFYASYIGFGAENQPVKIITEFIEIKSE